MTLSQLESNFLTVLVRNQSDFDEVRELFKESEFDGFAAMDALCESLRLEGDIEELVEQYVRGEYDPLGEDD